MIYIQLPKDVVIKHYPFTLEGEFNVVDNGLGFLYFIKYDIPFPVKINGYEKINMGVHFS